MKKGILMTHGVLGSSSRIACMKFQQNYSKTKNYKIIITPTPNSNFYLKLEQNVKSISDNACYSQIIENITIQLPKYLLQQLFYILL